MGAVGAFNGAIEFQGARGQNEEPNAALLAGLTKCRSEFTAPVDLNRPSRVGGSATVLKIKQADDYPPGRLALHHRI